MSLPSRSLTLTALAMVTLSAGIVIGTTLSASSATAQTSAATPAGQVATTRLTLTGLLQVPGEQTFIFRVEDKEYGVVCYVSPTSSVATAYSLGCVKR